MKPLAVIKYHRDGSLHSLRSILFYSSLLIGAIVNVFMLDLLIGGITIFVLVLLYLILSIPDGRFQLQLNEKGMYFKSLEKGQGLAHLLK